MASWCAVIIMLHQYKGPGLLCFHNIVLFFSVWENDMRKTLVKNMHILLYHTHFTDILKNCFMRGCTFHQHHFVSCFIPQKDHCMGGINTFSLFIVKWSGQSYNLSNRRVWRYFESLFKCKYLDACNSMCFQLFGEFIRRLKSRSVASIIL